MNKKFIKNIISIIWPFRYGAGVLILNYHSINSNHKYSTRPEDFDEQMKYLSNNFNVIKLKDFRNYSNKLNIVITFDDGFFDNYEYAFPILKKYNLPATIFLVSDFVFNNFDITKDWLPYNGLRPLSIEQIKEMSSSGLINFGSHGKTHDCVSELSEEKFKFDLIASKNQIELYSGQNIESYAFPFGQKLERGDFDLDFFLKIGFNNICTTDWGINKNVSSLKFLKRIRIDSNDTMYDFRKKISGSWNFVAIFQYLKNLKCHSKKY